MDFALPADFPVLFQRELHQASTLTGRDAFNRAILIVAGMVVGAGVLLELPSRPFFRPHAPGNSRFIFGLGVAVLVGSYYLYKVAWRPWHYGPSGYRLVGEFEVCEKNHLFSKCWVRLTPGDSYQLKVTPEVYDQLYVGSRLRLVYSAECKLVSLTQLM